MIVESPRGFLLKHEGSYNYFVSLDLHVCFIGLIHMLLFLAEHTHSTYRGTQRPISIVWGTVVADVKGWSWTGVQALWDFLFSSQPLYLSVLVQPFKVFLKSCLSCVYWGGLEEGRGIWRYFSSLIIHTWESVKPSRLVKNVRHQDNMTVSEAVWKCTLLIL